VVEFILGLGEDLIFGMCLGVNAIALVLNRNFKKLGYQ
jgi:cell shape-determining protein MreD